MPRINMGDYVKDSISGFKGIVVAAHSYLHGCVRLTVMSKSLKNGKPDELNFDEPQLVLITPKKVKKGRTSTGGPDKHVDAARML